MPNPLWADASSTSTPATVSSLVTDLHGIGVEHGDVVMAHTSMRAIGWVIGGEQAVIDALLQSVGLSGTLVMPTQSWQLCDPAFLGEDHVPESWWPVIREQLPAYDPARTPTRTMGPNCFAPTREPRAAPILTDRSAPTGLTRRQSPLATTWTVRPVSARRCPSSMT
jgi:hypothetical protein